MSARDPMQPDSANRNPQANQPFSIATPAVTTVLPDDSFLIPPATYHSQLSEALPENSYPSKTSDTAPNSLSGLPDLPAPVGDASTNKTATDPETAKVADTINEEDSKTARKRGKTSKKGLKMDTKSKLEKSRQSARECRARKKLRYQYLEDLVCNRERAVVKLREELTVFCDLSKQIDEGSITEADKRLLVEQSKVD